MSTRLHRITAKEMIRVLERRGFVLSKSSGSHHIFRNPDGVRATVPIHAGKTLHPKVLQSILRQADMTVEELKVELDR